MLYSAVAVAAFAGSTLVSAAPVLNARKAAHPGWAHKILEDYLTYHTRYIALSCYTQHNTTFFSDCCHPLRANETLVDNRLEYCAPNSTALASASARVAAAASAAATASAAVSALPSDDASAQWVSIAVDNYEPLPTGNLDAVATSIEASWSAADVQTTEAATTTTTEEPAPTTTTTTEEPAPTTTTTTEEPAPTTTTTTEEPKPTTTTTTEEPAQTTATSGGSGTTYSGEATWYKQSEGAHWSGLGSCGKESFDYEYVAAISTTGGSWGNNVACFKSIVVTNTANGKSVKVQIVDTCPSCNGGDSIDLSPPAFAAIANPDTGIVPITWQFA